MVINLQAKCFQCKLLNKHQNEVRCHPVYECSFLHLREDVKNECIKLRERIIDGSISSVELREDPHTNLTNEELENDFW